MEKYLLKLVDLFAWVFTLLQVDHSQLRAIVATKLIMDNRRQVVGYTSKDKTETSSFVVTLLLYTVIGGIVAFAMYRIPSFIFSMIVFFSYMMVMVSMTLITDFSSILLDTSDNTIILPRPVDGRTLFAARMTHILLYLGQLALVLSIIPAVVVTIQYGVGLVSVFLLAIALAICAAVFITNALYLLILNFTTEEKVKTVINYLQIFMGVAIMGGYQILPRMMERMDMGTFVFQIKWWSFLLPPVWMAGAMETFQFNLVDAAHIVLSTSAVIIPLAGIYLVNKYFSPFFNNRLSALGGTFEPVKKSKKVKTNGITNISSWITKSPTERGAFDMVYKILGRDRKIKLKIYPAFGYVLVFGLIFMIRSQEDLLTTWSNLPTTQYHLVLLYLMFMVLQVALYEIPYSDDFKASWIFYSSPVTKPGEILMGTVKAILVRLFLPAYLGISVLILFIWGIRVIDDVLFGMLNNFLMVMIIALINKRVLPLSMPPNVRSQSGNLARNILTFLLIALLGACHFLLTQMPHILIGAIPLQVLGLYFMQRAYKHTAWSKITL